MIGNPDRPYRASSRASGSPIWPSTTRVWIGTTRSARVAARLVRQSVDPLTRQGTVPVRGGRIETSECVCLCSTRIPVDPNLAIAPVATELTAKAG